ncbi:unnamed protein product [Ascophyllum nodosum]
MNLAEQASASSSSQAKPGQTAAGERTIEKEPESLPAIEAKLAETVQAPRVERRGTTAENSPAVLVATRERGGLELQADCTPEEIILDSRQVLGREDIVKEDKFCQSPDASRARSALVTNRCDENQDEDQTGIKYLAASTGRPRTEDMFRGGRQHTGPSSRDLVGMDVGVPDNMEVIDWDAAVDQCSGDVEFLEELLVDLWNESSAHAKQLREFVPSGDMLDTKHEAHSIKGAAANLMCHRLRTAAAYLEQGGQVGTRLEEGGSEWRTVKQAMELGLQQLELEMGRLENMLKQKKIL